jgi:hypothetical protein
MNVVSNSEALECAASRIKRAFSRRAPVDLNPIRISRTQRRLARTFGKSQAFSRETGIEALAIQHFSAPTC